MTKLAAIIDVLLPGEEGFPPGSTTQVAAWLAARPDRFAAERDAVSAALPEQFDASDVAAAQAANPEAFASLLTGIYTAYYSDPAVRLVIERTTGYSAGTLQPTGYLLAPFDPKVVAVPAARAPS